jgi:hypothetical protein
MYVVEIIRYGKPNLGLTTFGIFDNIDTVFSTLIKYNSLRAGKYPAFYIQEFKSINNEEPDFYGRIRYDIVLNIEDGSYSIVKNEDHLHSKECIYNEENDICNCGAEIL